VPAGLDADVLVDGDAAADDDGAVLADEAALAVDEGPPAAGCRRRADDDPGCVDGTADGLAVT
jgi:hypothetical protein